MNGESGDERGTPGSGGLRVGAAFGRYVILDRVGEGGMGVVYSAYDRELDRKVALKLLLKEGDQEARQRLLREAQAMARLSHPNVVTVHDAGLIRDRMFLAMEFVEGQDLDRYLAERRPGWREVVRLFHEAGKGLAAAHRAGLVHRDFKPANVLVGEDGRVRVGDFGLARPGGPTKAIDGLGDMETLVEVPGETSARRLRGQPLTAEGIIMGTPRFMAPEQILEGVADAATDQFSFCVALYEKLFDQHPFAKGTQSEVVRRMASGEALPPPSGTGVPSRVRRAVLRGLSAKREDRFPDMAALLAELAYDPGVVRKRRVRVAIGVAAAVLLALSVHTLLNRRAALCSGGDERLAAFWNQGRQESLREHFGELGSDFPADAAEALIRAVNDRGRRWVEAYTEVCSASRLRGEVSTDVMDRQMACLEQRLEETRQLLELLGNADVELAASAADAVAGLPGLAACMSSAEMLEEDPLPDDSARRREIKSARQDLAQGEALKAAGRFQEALQTAVEVSKTADGLGFTPLQAEARFLAGNVAIELGRTETAERELRSALTAAGKGGARRLAVWIANDLTWVYGVMKSEVDRALWWSDLAESWAGRLQSAEAEMWEILSTRADVLATAGRAREALELQRRVSEQALNEGHRDDEMAAHAHLGLADALYQVGEYREALGHYRLAAALREQLMGPDHPQVAVVLVSLGSVLTQLNQYDEALPVLKRALDINERVFGRDSPVLSVNLNNIASALEGMQRYEEALEVHRRGIDLVTQTWGPDHPQTAFTHLNTLSVYRQLGRLDEALVEAREARRVLVKAYGPDHPLCAYAENAEGVMYLLMGQPGKAVGPLERAVAIREKAGVDQLAAAESRFSLAKAVWELGQRDRAHRLARQAREVFAADGTQRGREDAALLDEWFSQRH